MMTVPKNCEECGKFGFWYGDTTDRTGLPSNAIIKCQTKSGEKYLCPQCYKKSQKAE